MRPPLYAKKRFGQNFLHEQSVLNTITNTVLQESPGKKILEIGPGRGALSDIFLKSAASLWAIELDRDLVTFLSNKYAQAIKENRFVLFSGDVLKFNLAQAFADYDIDCLVGNLPYNISTPFLISYASLSITCPAVFLIQKEVAERLTAQPGSKDFGRLSLSIQHSFTVEYVCDVGPECFHPQPKVQSQVILLRPKTQRVSLHPYFQKIVDTAFQQRRKTLRNALSQWDIEFQKIHIDPQRRPETLSEEDWNILAHHVQPKSIIS